MHSEPGLCAAYSSGDVTDCPGTTTPGAIAIHSFSSTLRTQPSTTPPTPLRSAHIHSQYRLSKAFPAHQVGIMVEL